MSSPESLPRMTPKEYLAYEQDQSIRHELVDGYLYAMTGASDRHEEIALNLAAALNDNLRDTGCRVYKGDLKIRVADDFYYPDVFVRRGEQRGDPYFKTDPILVAEVLSPGTQRYDRGDKRLAYWNLKSLQGYLLIAQDRMHVEIHRKADPEHCEQLDKPHQIIKIESIDFTMALSELYE